MMAGGGTSYGKKMSKVLSVNTYTDLFKRMFYFFLKRLSRKKGTKCYYRLVSSRHYASALDLAVMVTSVMQNTHVCTVYLAL